MTEMKRTDILNGRITPSRDAFCEGTSCLSKFQNKASCSICLSIYLSYSVHICVCVCVCVCIIFPSLFSPQSEYTRSLSK